MRLRLGLLLILLSVGQAEAQYPRTTPKLAADPVSGCGAGAGKGLHYFNTTSNAMKVCDGTNWIALGAAGAGGAPSDAEYWVGAADGDLSAEHNLGALGTGLVLNTGGVPTAYAGTSCANQFPRSLNASGAATCAAVSLTTDVSGTLGMANGGTSLTSAADDNLMVGSGFGGWQSKAVPDCDDTGGNHLNYRAGTNTFSCGTSSSGGGGPVTSILASPVAVAVSASYVTIFTVTPTASKTNSLRFMMHHTASAATIGMQFRVRSADAGNVGSCAFTHFGINATATSNIGQFNANIAIAAAPADSASLASFLTTFNKVEIDCAFVSDGTPGDVILEAQLETGTTSANILAGSSYVYITN